MKLLPALIGAVWLAAGVAQAAAAPAAGSTQPALPNPKTASPTELVQSIAQSLLHDLTTHRAEYQAHPKELNQLVNRYLLPYFDTQLAARLVLGRHWRAATPEQRKRFTQAFYNSLVNTYGSALLEFTSNSMQILPSRVAPKAQQATVRTRIRRSNGAEVPVNFELHRTPAGWKAWDVVIQGISYVKSFRDQFGAEIEQKGLDELIGRLEKGGKVEAPGLAPAHGGK